MPDPLTAENKCPGTICQTCGARNPQYVHPAIHCPGCEGTRRYLALRERVEALAEHYDYIASIHSGPIHIALQREFAQELRTLLADTP